MYAEKLVVMVLLPHQDDEALGPGATIAKLVDRGATVHIVSATGGQLGIPGKSHADTMTTRMRELENAGRALQVNSVGTLGVMDGDLIDSVGLRDQIVAAVEKVGANLVITTAPDDYHTDHRALGTAVLNCQHRYTKGAPALVFCDQFVRGIGVGTACPDIWLDATAHWDRKQAAYACHASQGGHLAQYMDTLGQLRGMQRKPRVRYAECFRGTRTAGGDEGLRRLILALES